jgi:hypothetical protein
MLTCNPVLQASRDSVEPTIVQTYVAGHKDPDPDHPEILCDRNATQKLVHTNTNSKLSFCIFHSKSMFCRVAILKPCERNMNPMSTR